MAGATGVPVVNAVAEAAARAAVSVLRDAGVGSAAGEGIDGCGNGAGGGRDIGAGDGADVGVGVGVDIGVDVGVDVDVSADGSAGAGTAAGGTAATGGAGGAAGGEPNGSVIGLFNTSHKLAIADLPVSAAGTSAGVAGALPAGEAASPGAGATGFFLKKLNIVWGCRGGCAAGVKRA